MHTSQQQRYFFFIALAAVLVVAFFVLKPFLVPLALGIIFAVILHPVHAWMVRQLGGWESVAALCTVVLTIIVLLAAISFLGARIAQEVQQFLSEGGTSTGVLEEMIVRIGDAGGRIVPGTEEVLGEMSANVREYVQQGISWLTQHVGSAFSSLAAMLLSLFIFFISLFYLLRDGEALRRTVLELSPLSNDDDETVLTRLGEAINSVVKGQLSIALIQSILTGVGFAVFGVPSPILWGMVAFLAALVPSVGTALVIAPGVLYLLFTGSIGMAVGLALWGVLAVGLVDNLLAPRLIGRGMKLHPLLVLLAVLGGIALFGAVGIFLGPLTLSLLFALLSLNRYLSTGTAS